MAVAEPRAHVVRDCAALQSRGEDDRKMEGDGWGIVAPAENWPTRRAAWRAEGLGAKTWGAPPSVEPQFGQRQTFPNTPSSDSATWRSACGEEVERLWTTTHTALRAAMDVSWSD